MYGKLARNMATVAVAEEAQEVEAQEVEEAEEVETQGVSQNISRCRVQV